MKIKELVEWLSNFHDQEAEVKVVGHESGTGYYDQGGNATEELFDPEIHAEYTDLRGNPFVSEEDSFYNKSYLLLVGSMVKLIKGD